MSGMSFIKRMWRRPALRELKLSCAHCGHDKFRVHVKPFTLQGESPGADVTEVVCDQCERYWRLDQGTLQTNGKVQTNNPMKEIANG